MTTAVTSPVVNFPLPRHPFATAATINDPAGTSFVPGAGSSSSPAGKLDQSAVEALGRAAAAALANSTNSKVPPKSAPAPAPAPVPQTSASASPASTRSSTATGNKAMLVEATSSPCSPSPRLNLSLSGATVHPTFAAAAIAHTMSSMTSTSGSAAAAASSAPPAAVTYLFRTPRGRTAMACVPPSAPYDAFVRALLEAAARRDGYDAPNATANRRLAAADNRSTMMASCHHHNSKSVKNRRDCGGANTAAAAGCAAEPAGAEDRRVRRRMAMDPLGPTSGGGPAGPSPGCHQACHGPSNASASASASASAASSSCHHAPQAPQAAPTEAAFFVHRGKVFGRDEYDRLASSSKNSSRSSGSEVHLTLHLRLLGGMADRQNRAGSKFGGGGVSSDQQSERERKERLRELALESIDLARDPYLMRNHLGTYECKLCLTLHTNEANYLAHTQGKKHQSGLARRAMMEKRKAQQEGSAAPGGVGPSPLTAAGASSSSSSTHKQQPRVRIGRPGYEITKSRDPQTHQRCLTFYLHYPEVDDPRTTQPRHRFMSSYEQRVEHPPDGRYQYLLVACDPYETVAFKVPNEPIDRGEGRFVTNWDGEGRRFTLTMYFVDPEEEDQHNGEEEGRADAAGGGGGGARAGQ